ncbi:UbiX family flavin prenyltransferase [Hydrogenimonas sp. SS33]|uniref:UbiX family flavin prenyltransferase n=1 Tax=Hydrogenimonas leucolamina TaxID=2954236 RepID=UPI00336BC9A6
MRLVVAVTGASGVELGLKAVELLPEEVTPYLILSDNAQKVLENENLRRYDNSDIGAPVASGSFPSDAMMVTPCSMNTLAKIACGIADNLTTRAAAVMIKERRPLLLAPREMPYSAIALENMLKLSRLGVIIAPPVMGYYSRQSNLEEMERFIVGKWFDLLGIPNRLYKRWRIEDA